MCIETWECLRQNKTKQTEKHLRKEDAKWRHKEKRYSQGSRRKPRRIRSHWNQGKRFYCKGREWLVLWGAAEGSNKTRIEKCLLDVTHGHQWSQWEQSHWYNEGRCLWAEVWGGGRAGVKGGTLSGVKGKRKQNGKWWDHEQGWESVLSLTGRNIWSRNLWIYRKGIMSRGWRKESISDGTGLRWEVVRWCWGGRRDRRKMLCEFGRALVAWGGAWVRALRSTGEVTKKTEQDPSGLLPMKQLP